MVIYATDKIENRAQAYDLLSQGADAVWGFQELPFTERTSSGKPFFPDFPDHHFNLSHSGSFALCALSDSPVGVDIQIVRDSWRDALPRRVCAPHELEWLEEQSAYWDAFALLWALKEARVKYDGRGLGAGVREISVPLPTQGKSVYQHDGLYFGIYEGTGWKASVCGEREPPKNLIWV